MLHQPVLLEQGKSPRVLRVLRKIPGGGGERTHPLLIEMAEFKCLPSVTKLMEVRMTYLRLIMYSTGKFLEEFPIKLLFITILTKDSTTAWYITFKNWTLI